MITLQHVLKSFGPVAAVRDVSFDVGPGRVTALLGPNGAGKTTTMRIITGSVAPDRGRVVINGREGPVNDPAARRGVGFVAETAALYPEMTPMAYLAYRARLYGLEPKSRVVRTAWVIEATEIGPVARQRIGTLSKGYRQRVGLAAALLHDPPALVLDEPTSGLDPQQIRGFQSLITSLAATKTVLLSSHALAEVEAVAGSVVVMARGRVVYQGPLHDPDDAPSALTVECAADPSAPAATDAARLSGLLLTVPGVSRVEALPAPAGWHRLRLGLEAQPGGPRAPGASAPNAIDPNPSAANPRAPDPRAPVARALAGANRLVRELSPNRRSLEARFMAMLTEDAGDRARTGGPNP